MKSQFCTECVGYRSFLRGRCVAADRHLKPCAECGRPSTSTLCSGCTESSKPGLCSLADLTEATEDKK